MPEIDRITGNETLEELKAKYVEKRRLSLEVRALIRFIDRFVQGKLTAAQVQELGDFLESDGVDYLDANGDGIMAQVLFEMSTPEANADIDRQVAERWRTMLSQAIRSR
jgi:hypothetical protein